MPSTTDHTITPWRTAARTRAGVVLLGVAVAAWGVWLGWRIATLPHGSGAIAIVSALVLALEVSGVLAGVLVAWGLMGATRPRHVLDPTDGADNPEPSHRFAHVVADVVGRTRAEDLHRDVRVVARAVPRLRRRSRADWAVAAVLIDGPRRLATVTVITIALLVGVSPIGVPPVAAMAALGTAVAAMSGTHVVLSGGRIAVGDRLRWTYSSLGEVVVREDLEGVAPRRWVGTVAAVVALDLALALRGISDRWTHGLPAMDSDQRRVVMVIALVLVLGAVFTLLTTPTPQLDNAHLVARRLEERTARQSLLAAVIVVGVVGLLAGLFTGNVDAADDDSVRIEQISEREARSVVDD